MRIISLIPVGEVFRGHLETLAEGLTARLGVACSVPGRAVDASSAFHPQRRQYNSTEILKILAPYLSPETWRVLGVTELDLFIPILTFVFGEARLGGRDAVVSLRRLRQEFYGMPADPEILEARLLKESLHELGHTLGLRHCSAYRCAMSSSHAVENIDLKDAEFCARCLRVLEL
jgi:archaemetzincin